MEDSVKVAQMDAVDRLTIATRRLTERDARIAWLESEIHRIPRRCAEIAESAQGMWMHVEGALAVAAEIRREFGLEKK